MHNYARMNPALDLGKWRSRLARSGYFLIALLLHLVLFLMFATWIIFKSAPPPEDNARFVSTTIRTPPPPAPPPPAGGEAANNLEPTTQVAPAPAAPSLITTSVASAFTVQSVKVAIPNLPTSMSVAVGSGLTGHDTPGLSNGAGSPFGSAQSSGGQLLQGYLYDLKQTADRQPTNMDPGKYHQVIKRFVAANWDGGILGQYYKSPTALNTSSIFIPTIKATDGPKAFGVEKDVQPNMYVVWYKVTAAPSQDGTYHFVGVGDDILVVRVNGKTVLDGCLGEVDPILRKKQTSYTMTNFRPTCPMDAPFWVGSAFHVSAAESVDIDVLIGEEPGGQSNYFLFIQREESTYQTQDNGTPLLPIFQLDPKPVKPDGVPPTYPPFSATPEPWQAATKSGL